MTNRTCSVIWNEDDVRQVEADWAEPIDPGLSDDEVEDILISMEENHDANYGITWDTIEYWIRSILNDRKYLEKK